jgi:hypothetical protein
MSIQLEFNGFIEIDAKDKNEAEKILENYVFDAPFYFEVNDMKWYDGELMDIMGDD